MNILIAPDSFKESLTSIEVTDYLTEGFKKAKQDFEITKLPLADGGEGTVKSLVAATDGEIKKKEVTDPLGNKVEAIYGILGDKKTGVIEMATASGLPLVPRDKRNPARTTTYGTGELIKAALDQGCTKLIIGIGGSATNDCGVGMAQALGGKFLDEEGKQIGYGGRYLKDIEKIDLSQLDSRIAETEIEVACDVDNPLYGKNGAAYIYGPQKGASKKQVKQLDKGLRHIAEIIKNDLGKEVNEIPGAGAAGGLGAGLSAFLDAELRPGIEIVMEASKIEEKMKDIDLVVTGEGKIDGQTCSGKTPVGVSRIAKKKDIPVIAVAGTIGEDAEKVYEEGINFLYSVIDKPMTLKEAIDSADELLLKTGYNLGKFIDSFL